MLDLGGVDLLLGKGEHGRSGHELGCQVEHVRGEGRRQKARIDALLGQVALDFLHVRIEADGEHAVGLVKDQGAQRVQGERSSEQMVQHAARRADDELGAFLQLLQLLLVAHAAVEGCRGDACAGKEDFRLLRHLGGKLSGGHQHQCLHHLFVRTQGGHQRQQVGAGLAGSCAGLDHDVPAVHKVGQGCGLHRHEGGPAGPGAGLLHGRGQLVHLDGLQSVVRMGDVEFGAVLLGQGGVFCGRRA